MLSPLQTRPALALLSPLSHVNPPLPPQVSVTVDEGSKEAAKAAERAAPKSGLDAVLADLEKKKKVRPATSLPDCLPERTAAYLMV